jgi:hypothetical protein
LDSPLAAEGIVVADRQALDNPRAYPLEDRRAGLASLVGQDTAFEPRQVAEKHSTVVGLALAFWIKMKRTTALRGFRSSADTTAS